MIGFLRLCRPLDEPAAWFNALGDGKEARDDTAQLLRVSPPISRFAPRPLIGRPQAIVSSTTLRRYVVLPAM